MSERKQGGFTLIELMIVVVILGILAALAIPRFMQTRGRAKQTEAKQVLQQIQDEQRLFFAENNFYAAGIQDLGVDTASSSWYDYVLTTSEDGKSFEAVATGNLDEDNTLDVWKITQEGEPHNTCNDVKQ